jgi:NAD+ synthase (glutamine-hydrolysing)
MDWGEHGFLRVAAVVPPLHLGDPAANAREILAAARASAARHASIAVFPELSLTGYTCEDLFLTSALIQDARSALDGLARATADVPITLVVGVPLAGPDGRLYNCGAVLSGGRLRGAVPKIHLPNYGEFYERRWFASGAGVDLDLGGGVRIASKQLFRLGPATVALELCEDLWAPVPESGAHALAGATLLLNLSASNDWVTKADYRRELVKQQSGRLNAAYVYVSAGPGESVKDLVFGGHVLVAENGGLVRENARFELGGSATFADLDLQRLEHERRQNMTFAASPSGRAAYLVHDLGSARPLPDLDREIARTPFVPADPVRVEERAREILALQSTGLAKRLQTAGSKVAVLGLSGGLDSTLAALVAVEAARRLGRPASSVLAVSMPGPGTSERTRKAAAELAVRLGLSFREIPIGPAVQQHFRDIGHDPSKHDVVFENVQARERTQILFDLANQGQGLLIGTGDMSELALGWCTYNGDHMGHYAVNVSVPKTLVKHLVRAYADRVADAGTRSVLIGILETPISPELLPPGVDGEIAQSTESLLGPYELHDFFLYHWLRGGARPGKILALAESAFRGVYESAEIRLRLRGFVERFFRQQFKRSCLPPGPKVGSVSLSPRGDLRMPDEADPKALIEELGP